MKLIEKDNEPISWRIYRQTPGADYAATPDLRKSLYKEQGGICAYCMQRLIDETSQTDPLHIQGERVTNRVEHIKSREEYPDKKLDYSNMVLCCCGKSYKQGLFIHCDRSKGDNSISFSPLDSFFIATISYASGTGEIKSTPVYQKEINEILKLNNNLLKENRRKALKGVIDLLGRKKWTSTQLKALRDKWAAKDSDGLYKPYCALITWYLDKKIKLLKGR